MAGTGGLTPGQEAVLGAAAGGFPDAPIVVALGGGADSAVCAWAAVACPRVFYPTFKKMIASV